MLCSCLFVCFALFVRSFVCLFPPCVCLFVGRLVGFLLLDYKCLPSLLLSLMLYASVNPTRYMPKAVNNEQCKGNCPQLSQPTIHVLRGFH